MSTTPDHTEGNDGATITWKAIGAGHPDAGSNLDDPKLVTATSRITVKGAGTQDILNGGMRSTTDVNKGMYSAQTSFDNRPLVFSKRTSDWMSFSAYLPNNSSIRDPEWTVTAEGQYMIGKGATQKGSCH